jgi:hypothetical protein
MTRDLKLFWLTADEMDGVKCPCRNQPCRPDCPDLLTTVGHYACKHPQAPRYEPIQARVALEPCKPTQRPQKDPHAPCCPDRSLRWDEMKCPLCGGATSDPRKQYNDDDYRAARGRNG